MKRTEWMLLWLDYFLDIYMMTFFVTVRCIRKQTLYAMKNRFILFGVLLLFIGCSNDGDSDPRDIILSIETSGLNDDKLAINNSAIFTASISGYNGDISTLSYRWTLSMENGELSDGVNPLPNPSNSGNSIDCIGRTSGDEQITVEVLDSNNNIIATSNYDFTIVSSTDPTISRGCFDQPKIVFRRGTLYYIMNFDGSNEEYLGLGGGAGVAISPNGEWIAHIRDTQRGYRMHVFRCDGSTGLIDIEDPIFRDTDTYPRFSPDSKTLYFLRARDPDYSTPTTGVRQDIAAYDLETGQLSFLTSFFEQGEGVAAFTVSPVTGVIAFIRAGEEGIPLSFLQPSSGLITDFTTLPDAGYSMDWSPDGSNIIYRTDTDQGNGIFRINITDGSQPLLVFADQTENTVGPTSPYYYEGGSRIVFVDQDMGQQSLNLWTIDANGNDLQPLLETPSGDLFLVGILH